MTEQVDMMSAFAKVHKWAKLFVRDICGSSWCRYSQCLVSACWSVSDLCRHLQKQWTLLTCPQTSLSIPAVQPHIWFHWCG